ncbi:hypothetical protein ACFY1B_51775 [Streptomyces mirabilis]|uniref:hypothetical protein n=1 Tax=Streptomyces mirabilis TaxID=68239 RepID=UPI0036D12C59
MRFDTESVGTEPYTAEDPGQQGQVRGASASEIANLGAFPDGYIGDSTRNEIEYARRLGKPIRYTHAAGEDTSFRDPGSEIPQ